MSLQQAIIWDRRVKGWKPMGKHVLTVNSHIPIELPISWACRKGCDYGGDLWLRIMGHGFQTLYGVESDEEELCYDAISQGGGGVQFCRENITVATITRFSRLRGKVKLIDLLACGAAYITPGKEGMSGDGNYLCYRLAQITGAFVRASTATQLYSPGTKETGLSMGRWEGMVYLYHPDGHLVSVRNEPMW